MRSADPDENEHCFSLRASHSILTTSRYTGVQSLVDTGLVGTGLVGTGLVGSGLVETGLVETESRISVSNHRIFKPSCALQIQTKMNIASHYVLVIVF